MNQQQTVTAFPSLDELINDFSIHLKRSNKSAHTITAYCGSVKLFFQLYQQITPDTLRSYRQYLIERYRPATVNQRIIAINCYSRFLTEAWEDDYLSLKEYQLHSVKLQQKSFLDTVISNEDYELLKRRLKADHKDMWYFVVRFLGATGARVSELTQIKVEDLMLGYLDLYSKGGKLRRIYLPETLCHEALHWCTSRHQLSGFLFLNKQGHPITTRGIHCQLKNFAHRYGINPDTVYPHSFRHRFAKNFLSKCSDIALLADLLGHENIETTRIYLTRSSQEQQELMDQLITW